MRFGWPDLGNRILTRRILLVFAAVLAVTGSAGCKQGPWNLWKSYSARFIDPQGRVIDPKANDHTTSEGQSYALFFALVDNDRTHFDRVLGWTQQNLSGGDMGSRLPGWNWGKAQDGQWTLVDPNSASDSDCWIAYSLLEAGRLWREPKYTALGKTMLHLIEKQEVAELPGFGSTLMPGPTATWVHGHTFTVNPSYLPLFLFERFQDVDPGGPWGAIAMNIPRLLRQSSRHGFAMDWADYVASDGFYPSPPPGPKENGKADKPALGSYDAIRVYLWAGMLDDGGRTRTDMAGAVSGMAAYLSNHPSPPEKVNAEGVPQEGDGPVGFSAAVLPYLRALPDMAKVATEQRIRVGAQLDASTGLYGKDPAYYDQNLILFATGFSDGRFRFGPHGELKVEWTR
jgi:endoglucanase